MKMDSFSFCCAADDAVLQMIIKEFWHGTTAVKDHCHAKCFAGMNWWPFDWSVKRVHLIRFHCIAQPFLYLHVCQFREKGKKALLVSLKYISYFGKYSDNPTKLTISILLHILFSGRWKQISIRNFATIIYLWNSYKLPLSTDVD